MSFGDRLRQTRELRRLTQFQLAERLGVTQSFISQIEGGQANPPSDIVAKLTFEVGFPPSFFEQPINDDFPFGSLLFRAHSSMTDSEQREIYRWAQVVYEMYRAMTLRHPIKELPLHVPRAQQPAPTAAELARSELGLGPDTPIPNLINAVEKAGVLVIALPTQFRGRDAFSLWATQRNDQRRPIIVVAEQSPDRLRMSVAHELGHLVMHHPLTVGMGDVEKQAKAFAACFLLPEIAMRRELGGPLSLDSLLNLKIKWGVSIQALIVRSRELDIISPRKYHYLFSKLAARGWRTHEPLSSEIPLERPRAMRKIAELIYGASINYGRLAADARLSKTFAQEIMKPYASRPNPTTETAKPPSHGRDVITFSLRKN
jgi:Zn-dependent peptidase ImmA (M78 family)/DNA-binding XRE family transcriptional regulator